MTQNTHMLWQYVYYSWEIKQATNGEKWPISTLYPKAATADKSVFNSMNRNMKGTFEYENSFN